MHGYLKMASPLHHPSVWCSSPVDLRCTIAWEMAATPARERKKRDYWTCHDCLSYLHLFVVKLLLILCTGAWSLILISLLNPKTQNLIMSLCSDIVSYWFWGYRGEIRTELQASVILCLMWCYYMHLIDDYMEDQVLFWFTEKQEKGNVLYCQI